MGVYNRFMSFLGLADEEEDWRDDPEQPSEPEPLKGQRKSKQNVVSIHSKTNIRVVLFEPRSYEEAQEMADHLRSRRQVVVNLQRVRKEHAVRIIDFLSGTVYALNGHISKVGTGIFLCTPDTVEVQGNISDILDEQNNE